MTDRVRQEDKRKSANGFEKDDGIPLKEQNQQDSEDGQIFEPFNECLVSIQPKIGSEFDFLKAEDYENPMRLNVKLEKSDCNDPETVFQILKSVEKMANFVKYSRNEGNFYLAAENDMEVQLRKLENPPEFDEYFFFIKKVNDECGPDSPVTFQSKKTGDYVHCSSDTGRVFMQKAVGNESPSDRETWFKLVDRVEPQDKLTSDVDSVDGSEVQKEKVVKPEEQGNGNLREKDSC